MSELIAKEVAIKEVNDWLDAMDYPKKAREHEDIKSYIEIISESVQCGDITFESEYVAVQKLRHPLANGGTTEIKYDFRFEVGAYHEKMKGKSPSDPVDFNIAKLSLVSGQVPGVFLKLMKYDYSVASKLALFF